MGPIEGLEEGLFFSAYIFVHSNINRAKKKLNVVQTSNKECLAFDKHNRCVSDEYVLSKKKIFYTSNCMVYLFHNVGISA